MQLKPPPLPQSLRGRKILGNHPKPETRNPKPKRSLGSRISTLKLRVSGLGYLDPTARTQVKEADAFVEKWKALSEVEKAEHQTS